jgi:hypothetical protein
MGFCAIGVLCISMLDTPYKFLWLVILIYLQMVLYWEN